MQKKKTSTIAQTLNSPKPFSPVSGVPLLQKPTRPAIPVSFCRTLPRSASASALKRGKPNQRENTESATLRDEET